MIGILLNDSAYEQDIRELLMAFYPGQTFAHEMQENLDFFVEGTANEDRTEFTLCLGYFGSSCFHLLSMEKLEPEIRAEFQAAAENSVLKVNYENRFETKNKIKRRLYVLLMQQTGKQLPVGNLNRHSSDKIAMTKLAEGETEEQIFRHMKDTYFTSDEKIHLSIEIAQRERKLLSTIDYKEGYSLYVGIPFCPTTCLYCSFTSYPIGKWKDAPMNIWMRCSKELLCGRKEEGLHAGHRLFWRRNPDFSFSGRSGQADHKTKGDL